MGPAEPALGGGWPQEQLPEQDRARLVRPVPRGETGPQGSAAGREDGPPVSHGAAMPPLLHFPFWRSLAWVWLTACLPWGPSPLQSLARGQYGASGPHVLPKDICTHSACFSNPSSLCHWGLGPTMVGT